VNIQINNNVAVVLIAIVFLAFMGWVVWLDSKRNG